MAGQLFTVTVDSYNDFEVYVFVCNLPKYQSYRGHSYDCTRKWSWKKENKMFLVMVLKDGILHVI